VSRGGEKKAVSGERLRGGVEKKKNKGLGTLKRAKKTGA